MPKQNKNKVKPLLEPWKYLERIAGYRNTPSVVFTDWLDFMLNAITSQSLIAKSEHGGVLLFDNPYEKAYMKIVESYKDIKLSDGTAVDYMAKAYASLIVETTTRKQDMLGDIFMEYASSACRGQFFTPHHVCDMMAQMMACQSPKKEPINDPCCGSGRLLISAWKVSPTSIFYATDLDERCVKMCLLNFHMLKMDGVVTFGDSLRNEKVKIWNVFSGYIIEASKEIAKIAEKKEKTAA